MCAELCSCVCSLVLLWHSKNMTYMVPGYIGSHWCLEVLDQALNSIKSSKDIHFICDIYSTGDECSQLAMNSRHGVWWNCNYFQSAAQCCFSSSRTIILPKSRMINLLLYNNVTWMRSDKKLTEVSATVGFSFFATFPCLELCGLCGISNMPFSYQFGSGFGESVSVLENWLNFTGFSHECVIELATMREVSLPSSFAQWPIIFLQLIMPCFLLTIFSYTSTVKDLTWRLIYIYLFLKSYWK